MPLSRGETGRDAGQLDLVFEIGSRWQRTFIWWDLFYEEDDARNVPRDLTGYSNPRLEIRSKRASSKITFLANDVPPPPVPGPDDVITNYITPTLGLGQFVVDIPSSVTSTFTAWRKMRAYHQFIITDPDGEDLRFISGRVSAE